MKKRLMRAALWTILLVMSSLCLAPAALGEASPGSGLGVSYDADYRSILGPGLNYAITAETLSHTVPLGANFAAGRYTVSGEALEAGSYNPNEQAGQIVIAEADKTEASVVRVANLPTNALLYVDEDALSDGLQVEDENNAAVVVPWNGTALKEATVAPVLSYMKQASALLDQPQNVRIITGEAEDTLVVDLLSLPENATVYLDADAYLPWLSRDLGTLILKRDTQTAVFNFRSAEPVSLGAFRCLVRQGMDGAEIIDTVWPEENGEEKCALLDSIARSVVFNFIAPQEVRAANVAGMMLLPLPESRIEVTGACCGWIESCGAVSVTAGGFYNVYADQASFDTAVLYAQKTVDGVWPKMDERFWFALSGDAQGLYENDGAAVLFYAAGLKEGTNEYTIRESEKADGNDYLFGLDEKVFTARVTGVAVEGKDVIVPGIPAYTDGETAALAPAFDNARKTVSVSLEAVNLVDGTEFPGRDINGHEIVFTLILDEEADNDASGYVWPEITERAKSVGNGETAVFGEIAFKKPGVYRFGITQALIRDEDQVPGLTRSTQKVIATVTVTEEAGELTAAVAYEGGEGEKGNTFINTYGLGGFSLTKAISGNAADKNAKYRFTVTLLGDGAEKVNTDSFNEGEIAFTNGVAEFEIGDGETYTATRLPAGMVYVITEEAANKDGYKTMITAENGVVDNKAGTVTGVILPTVIGNVDEKNAVTYMNRKQEYGSLTVYAETLGNDADPEKEFTITVELTGEGHETIFGAHGEMVFRAGTAMFTLKNGESITSVGLPYGMPFKVKQENENSDGYVTYYTGETGKIDSKKPAECTVTNIRDLFGGLLIKAERLGNDALRKSWFAVKITLNGPGAETVSGILGDVEFVDGVSYGPKEGRNLDPDYTRTVTDASGNAVRVIPDGYVKVYADVPLIIRGLPSGIGYTVEQDDYSAVYDSVTYTGKEGTIAGYVYTAEVETIAETDPEITTCVISNTRNRTGSLAIRVVNEGEAAGLDRAYSVFVSVRTAEGEALNGTFGGYSFTNGETVVTLVSGGETVIPSLPLGAAFTVTEQDLADAGFAPAAYEIGYRTAEREGDIVPAIPNRFVAGNSGAVEADGCVVTVTNTMAGQKQASLNLNAPSSGNSFTIQGESILEGREAKDGEFAFTLVDADGNAVAETANVGNAFAFSPLTFAQAGEYTYIVSEKAGTMGGVEYDERVYTVKITVTAAEDGKLQCKAAYTVNGSTADALAFESRYLAHGVANLTGWNHVTGRETDAEAFTYTVKEGDTVVATGRSAADGSIAFSRIDYDLANIGSHAYTVTQDPLELAGYTMDTGAYTVTVDVQDNGDGTLQAFVTGDGEDLAFENTYLATANLSITGRRTFADEAEAKVLLGTDGTLPAASYTLYEVIDGQEQEILTAMSNQTSGSIRFTAIAYTQEDVGSHTYVLRERDGGNDMVAYDEREYVIQVLVEDQGDGTLTVKKEITLNGEKTDEILFADQVNHTCLTIQKWVTGETTTQTFRFTVILRVDGEELTGTYTYRGSRTGKIQSGGTIELASGDNITIENLPEGVHYRVVEEECPRYRVIVNGQDTMTAEGEASGEEGELLEFTSSLIATTFTVYKQWVGVQGGKIRLIMYSDGVEMVPQPTVNWSGNSNTYTVDGLPKYTYGGRRIIYTAKEAYMSGYMTDYRNLEGLYADCAYDGCTIVNTAVKQMRVKGVFTGVAEGEKLPAIGLTIFRANGTELKHIEVSPDRKGWLNIYNLPLGYDYYVVADQMDGYRTSYKNAEDGAHAEETDKVWENGTITNHRIAKTGDTRPVEVWIFVLVASLIGMIALYVTGKKKAMNR